MAYAAVVSLEQILHQILRKDRFFNLGDDQKRNLILFLFVKVPKILHFLENPSLSNGKEVKLWEIKIRDVAYHAEDVIESWQTGSQKIARKIDSNMEEEDVNIIDLQLQKVITEIDTLVEEMVEIKDESQPWDFLLLTPAPSVQTTMVGFGEDLMQIKDRLCNEKPSTRQIIPILGMGGIGKTTLAKNVYNDSLVAYHFYICAWVSLSQQYCIREILLSLLDDIGVLTDEMRRESDEYLKEYTYKSLKGKIYLIVMDDVWSTDAWNEIQMLFPDDNNGSRILLTTRLTHVVPEYMISSTNTPHRMRFLTKEESWDLFQETVFGEENCPSELVDVGMNIAKNCQGLPLLIVVVAGLLAKVYKPLDYWKHVAVNLSSIVAEKDEHCSKILALSYNNLPPHLKPCFLYMGVFPDNYEIPVSRLIKLWVAEGFIKSGFAVTYMGSLDLIQNQNLYEVAEEYLMDLIDRNLILVGQKRSVSGKIKTCRMHDLLRALCVRIAHEENFLYVKSKYQRVFPEEVSFKRRLCINDDASYSDSEKDITMQSMDLVRSFIYNGWDETRLHSYFYFGCRLLRVLDMGGVELTKFPEEILLLVNLRYIAIVCHAVIPASISILWYLQTLIVEDPTGIASELPTEIWYMVNLRHLRFSRVFLPPSIDVSVFILENLETLSVLDNLYYDTIRTPNLKKLGIHHNESSQYLNHLLQLKKLESLKILFDSPANSTFIHNTLPPSLKKITLERGRMDWKDMTIFGSLPNLKVLKLREFAFQGREWVPNEGEFLKLKFLLISETDLVHLRANSTHFPCLEHLILRNCSNLVEIPSDIGEILTLQTIEIDYSSPSAVDSAKSIQDYQRSMGNNDLQVFVHPTKTKVYQKFGIEQDDSGRFYRRKTKLKAKAKPGSSSNP